MTARWRLIVHGRLDGALNMAIDRSIQLCREEGSSPPTVRLYGWARPTVTLGRFQPTSDVDLDACDSLGVDVVRRFTGGRGVLHDDELTYCVVASTQEGVPRGTAASYAHLCAALVHTYRSIGVEASLTPRDKGVPGSAACYLHSTRADLSSGPAKLSGSAQVWHGATVMQHGSFTLSRDIERDRQVFRLTAAQAEHLKSETMTLTDALSSAPDRETLLAACIEGFEVALGIRLEPGQPSAQEALRARLLVGSTRVHGVPAPKIPPTDV